MKTTFISTVYNEEKNMHVLLDSLLRQTKLPDEVIVVDGRSTDNTRLILKAYEKIFAKRKIAYSFYIKRGNRSVGRNLAVKKAKHEIILCSDSGNRLHPHWLQNLHDHFRDPSVDVVAGYNKGHAETVFQQCVIPYALVMPDKIYVHNYLPATRSMAFTKTIWKKAGGFPEQFSHNEDYVFAHTLRKIGAEIVFAKDAVVYWTPRYGVYDSFIMFFRFALGDAQAHIFRKKVMFIIARYIIGALIIFWSIINNFIIGYWLIGIALWFYVLWAIKKNYHYVKHPLAVLYLPLLQFISDIAIIMGTIAGIVFTATNKK